MKYRPTELAERRAQLQRKAAAQRAQLGLHVDAIESRTSALDQGFLKAQRLLQKPVLLAGGAALALFVGPVRAVRLVGKAALLIAGARRLLGFFR
jgi:hypothetical protein